VSLFLVLLNQRGQVLAEAEAVLVAAATLAVAADTLVAAGVSGALLVAALGLRQLSTVAAFEEHQLFGGHTLAAEVSAHRVPRLDSIMGAVA
jgi:hypothetical protein